MAECLKQADDALDQAKAAGRNRCVLFGEGATPCTYESNRHFMLVAISPVRLR
jgi:hypothetical protein